MPPVGGVVQGRLPLGLVAEVGVRAPLQQRLRDGEVALRRGRGEKDGECEG